ncbi:hypothetical protein P7C71_g3544, partial [Lecanoromycetidae sp. Uapishka_2]
MRLLHTKSLTFEEFFDGNTPKYAILSHRWGENEVSFKEMRKGTAQPGQGLSKILGENELDGKLSAERVVHSRMDPSGTSCK